MGGGGTNKFECEKNVFFRDISSHGSTVETCALKKKQLLFCQGSLSPAEYSFCFHFQMRLAIADAFLWILLSVCLSERGSVGRCVYNTLRFAAQRKDSIKIVLRTSDFPRCFAVTMGSLLRRVWVCDNLPFSRTWANVWYGAQFAELGEVNRYWDVFC